MVYVRVMRRKFWLLSVIMVLCFFCTVLISFQAGAQPNINFETFTDDYDETNLLFQTYNIGDKITIEDTIEDIHYWGDSKYRTTLWLESTGTSFRGKNLTFYSNLEEDYKPGEKVQITFEIIEGTLPGTEDYDYDEKSIKHVTIITEEEEKQRVVEERLEEKEKVAVQKLKEKRKKLTMDEFRILVEKGLI